MSGPRFPWTRAMEIGFGHLRLSPDAFWRMTLPELAAAARALGFGADAGGITRAELQALMQTFPDAGTDRASQGTGTYER